MTYEAKRTLSRIVRLFLGDAFGNDGFKSIGKDFGNNFVDDSVEGHRSKVFQKEHV